MGHADSNICVEIQWYIHYVDFVQRYQSTFHLGRIRRAKKLPHHFKRPAGFDVNETLLDSIGVYTGTAPEEIVLRFSSWAATVASERTWHSSQSVRSRDDETVEIKLRAAVNPEFERWLWSWGDAVEIMSPVMLRDRIRAAHQRAAVRNR